MTFRYPIARKSDVVEDFHGTLVPDPYRWMEDPESPELRTWLEAQAQITDSYLESSPERDSVKARLTELWDFERYTPPIERGGRYFFQKNDGLQNQSAWYMLKSLHDDPTLVIDPNTFSDDGTVALVNQAFSDDGKYMAYGCSTSGSDLQDIY